MGPLIPLIINAISWAAQHGDDIARAKDVGMSVVDVLKQKAPVIHDLFVSLANQIPAAQLPDGGVPAAVETMAKHAFGHMTTDQERAWMDRASQTTGL